MGFITDIGKRYSIKKTRSTRDRVGARKGSGQILFLLMMLITVLSVTGFEEKLLKDRLLTEKLIRNEVNYDLFREFNINAKTLEKSSNKINHILSQSPQWKEAAFLDQTGYITFSMMARNYDLVNNPVVDELTFRRGISKVAATRGFQELYYYYKAILSDLRCFPVPKMGEEDVLYGDSWLGQRSYGGIRQHEGTDLMASNNKRGYFPIISITDGTVEKMGWLEQGGYRVGIRSNAGGYFYYAHLYSYAPGLEIGDTVIAGQLLGFMGDSGYGREGTIGKFDVHLHLGIYVDSGTGEMSVNPYRILRLLEKYRMGYDYQ